jgi:hypothetical protein
MAIRRQSQGFANPLKDYIFELYGNRGHRAKRSVLIPSACHPAGGEGSRNHSAVHKSEITAARGSYCGWGTGGVQLFEYVGGVGGPGGKGLVKSNECNEVRWGRTDAAQAGILYIANRFFSGEI